MNFFEQLAGLLGNGSSAKHQEAYQAALARSQQHKYQGQYHQAIDALNEATNLEPRALDANILSSLPVLRAELLIYLADYTTTADVLRQYEAQMQTMPQNIEPQVQLQLAYGWLAQAQTRWEDARTHYEQALKFAREHGHKLLEGQAQGYLAETYLQEDNANFAVYLLQEGLPKIQSVGDAETNSYFSGLLGEALLDLDRTTEGQRYLGRALRLAEHLNHKAYELRWRRLLAIRALAAGAFAEARRHYLLILSQTNNVNQADIHIEALCHISKACLRLSEYGAALDYARQAVEQAEQARPHSDLEWKAHASLGIALRTNRQFSEAITELEAAASHYAHVALTEADHTYVDVLRNLAASQTEVMDYTTALNTYERALSYAQSESTALEVAGTYRDLGILYTRQKQLDEAVKAWTQSLEIYETEGQPARVARLYCDIANIRKQQGQGKRARKDYEQALMLLSSIDDLETRGIVLSNAATAYVDQGDIETAESFFIEAIKIAQKLGDRQAEATRRGNYGWFLLATGRAKRALATLEYALRQSDNLGLALQSTVQTDNMGLAYDELKDYLQATGYHQKALATVQKIGNTHWIAVIRANLAHSLIGLGEFNTASDLLDQAMAIAKQTHDPETIIKVLNGRAKLALQQEQSSEALKLSEKAITQARETDSRRLLADALTLQSVALAQNNELEAAQIAWGEAAKLYSILQINPADHAPAWVTQQP